MYITYNYLNTCNIKENEGGGSQYQKIISIYAVAKKNNLKYIHIPIKIGHNYDNDKDWNEKWDNMFNFKKLSYNHEIDIETIKKEFSVDGYAYEKLLNDKDKNKLHFYFHNFELFNNNPEYYFKDIQDELINAYDEINNNKKLIYDKNKINIVIHIRTYNNFDGQTSISFFEDYKNIGNKFFITCDIYEKLITNLQKLYKNTADIHIFSQEEYFDMKFKNLRNFKNLIYHFDYNVFDTFHHMCKADILVTGASSLSYVAALYNKNKIIHLKFYPCVLKSWIEYTGNQELKLINNELILS